MNQAYLDEMQQATDTSTLGRLRDLWFGSFIASLQKDGFESALDNLDSFMSESRGRLREMASEYATVKGLQPGTDRHRQVASNFLKSNTGKMFERFCGVALAYSLFAADAPYCVNPCRKDILPRCHNLTREDLRVEFVFGDGKLYTHIDADLFAFNPTDPEAELFLISIKSTLKDRFHNVPFWNLLRRCAISDDFPEVVARNRDVLEQVRYIAVCSDLAQEQPDFGTEAGARNLLQVDAALLDGAYVSASKAQGLPKDCTDHLGDVRQHAFYRYSCFFEYLKAKTE